MAGRISHGNGGRVVGDYMLGKKIGSGSFADVWHARHRIRGTEVAIKEIAMDKLTKKLRDSLLSEVVILKNIKHPNIIALHDIIQIPGRIFLVLEYCRGGDLSWYIQRHGRVPEVIAKSLMQQLASGLKVLWENNLMHRDLKPQNLLLSKDDNSSVLKIADFGFARTLEKKGLAETLCGSPLYMAPEIMELHKYDAKADLWSVGAILFQLVTGRTPFTGGNQVELLHNIINATELQFPQAASDLSPDCIDLCQKLLRRNPVERMTFEEFFNHPFLSQRQPEESRSIVPTAPNDESSSSECRQLRSSNADAQEERLPFIMEGVSAEQDTRASAPSRKSSIRSTYGFSIDSRTEKRQSGQPSMEVDGLSRPHSKLEPEGNSGGISWHKKSSENTKGVKSSAHERHMEVSPDHAVVDSLEFIDQEYVLVPGPPFEVSSSSVSASRPQNSSCGSETLSMQPKFNAISSPMQIGASIHKNCGIGSLSLEDHHCFPHSGASHGSVDMGYGLERPSSHCLTRIKSLEQCASALADLVKEKVEFGKNLEAFSLQLVILAIWKQALHICHAQAASAMEGSPSQEIKMQQTINRKESVNSQECFSSTESHQPDSGQIERAFLQEVENAEELAKNLEPDDETTEMPDAMELIFQSALALGRNGAVDELMTNMEMATNFYVKAVQLLYFLLVEAPSLILNPPFSLTDSDKDRLRSYMDMLNDRQSQYRSQRMTLLKDYNERIF